MSHQATIKPGSLKRNLLSGGIEFVMVCCGAFERSGHIQNLAAFADNEERQARIEQELREHEEKHAAEEAAEEFLRQYAQRNSDCGCPSEASTGAAPDQKTSQP